MADPFDPNSMQPGNEPGGVNPTPEPGKGGMSTGGKVALGCGVALLLALLLGGACVYYVAVNARGFMAQGVGQVFTQVVEESQLPPEQKQRIVARIDQLKQGFAEGDLTMEQLMAVAERLSQSPIFPVAGVMWFEEQYVAQSGLPDEEKDQARRTLDRFARGLYEGAIPQYAYDDVIAPISAPDGQGETTMKDTVTDEQLREALSRAKEKADEANVPDEPFDINVADEIDRAIDEALAQPTNP